MVLPREKGRGKYARWSPFNQISEDFLKERYILFIVRASLEGSASSATRKRRYARGEARGRHSGRQFQLDALR